jgi:hypothetical protein
MRHAYRNPLVIHHGDDDVTVVVGPAQSGQLLEIGFVPDGEDDVIIHAMPARPHLLR